VEIVFLRGAEADLFAAWVRYEEALPGLGDRFEAEVRAVLLRIAELPESAPIYLRRRIPADCWCAGLSTEFFTAFRAPVSWSQPCSTCAKTQRRSGGDWSSKIDPSSPQVDKQNVQQRNAVS
jgi:hypothetical protein